MNARQCKTCGEELVRKEYPTGRESAARFAARQYCDKRCMAAGMVKEVPTAAALRWRARKLRGAACEECGSAHRLHAHHRDGDIANNSADNITTLCASCHLKWHWANGKANKPRRSCSECSEPARKFGYCSKHYQRFKKYGDPRLTKRKVSGVFELVRD